MATALAGFGLTWLVQSSVLLALGLLAGRLLQEIGPGGPVGRLPDDAGGRSVCPVASAALSAAGFDGLTFRLPSPATGTARRARSATRLRRRSTSRRNRTFPRRIAERA